MIVELIEGTIQIPQEFLEDLQIENGQKMHLCCQDGALHAVPAEGESPSETVLTPDQQLAHYIADSFADLEEMVAMMAAIVDVKHRIPAGDTELAEKMGARIEEILVRARKENEAETDETC